MYEFNPLTSLELLQNLTQTPTRHGDDSLADHPERHLQPARSGTITDLVRRIFQRISSKRRAA